MIDGIPDKVNRIPPNIYNFIRHLPS